MLPRVLFEICILQITSQAECCVQICFSHVYQAQAHHPAGNSRCRHRSTNCCVYICKTEALQSHFFTPSAYLYPPDATLCLPIEFSVPDSCFFALVLIGVVVRYPRPGNGNSHLVSNLPSLVAICCTLCDWCLCRQHVARFH